MTVEHPRIQWFADPAVLAPLALMVWIYVRRFREARREAGGRGAGPLQAIAFAAGVLALLAALVSPIDGLGSDYLFSAHMVQHVLLGDIAPLLLLLSLSRVIMRPVTRRLMRVERALGPLASPWTAIAIWLGVMYLWHIPSLYDAAAEHPLLHMVEHLSFFAAGVALWWPLVEPVPMRRGLTGMQPIAYIALCKGGLAALGLFLAWSSTRALPLVRAHAADLGPQPGGGPERGRRDHDGRAVADARDGPGLAVRADADALGGGGAAARAVGGGGRGRLPELRALKGDRRHLTAYIADN